jgi:MoaA/NifB/PqqE/SkfB family radical SAM enzyme
LGAPPHPRVNDGNGFLFIDHIGTICPSGVLPQGCGNVRRDDLATVYRTHPAFTALRDPSNVDLRRQPQPHLRPDRRRLRLGSHLCVQPRRG